MKSKVYFSNHIDGETIVKLYKALNFDLKGNVAIKLHSGEPGNQNFLGPELWKDIISLVNGTVVECNTAYDGERNTTEKHKKLISEHNWDKYFNVDIMDENGNDLVLPIEKYNVIDKTYLGRNIENYDSMLVISHFKGHPMGGYGGALKQLSIGCASSVGKAWIHSAGLTTDVNTFWGNLPPQDKFLESMADASYAVHNYFKGNIVYINIMCNMSVDCDCCAKAEDPCMKDIGILSSTNPVLLDKACMDLIYKSNDPGKEHFLERVESRNGVHTIDVASKLFESFNYELVDIDKA